MSGAPTTVWNKSVWIRSLIPATFLQCHLGVLLPGDSWFSAIQVSPLTLKTGTDGSPGPLIRPPLPPPAAVLPRSPLSPLPPQTIPNQQLGSL